MGPDQEKESLVFPKLCVYLFDNDPHRKRYLEQIFAFVEGSIHLVESAEAITPLLSGADTGCGAVLLGSGWQRDEQRRLLERLSQEAPALPAFQIYSEEEGIPEKIDGYDNLIGNFRLPTHYDDLMALAHKAQVFQESHSPAGTKSRPVLGGDRVDSR
ncbi:MAG: hypothetical protein P8Z77_12440 [Candidatus Thiodiazotropha sp.]